MMDNENKNNCPYEWYKIGGMCPSILYKDKLKTTMSGAEKFIKDYTNHCSNIIINNTQFGGVEETQPWLTPNQARRAVEIAREEMYEWLANHYRDYMHNPTGKKLEAFFGMDMITDLKHAMKDE